MLSPDRSPVVPVESRRQDRLLRLLAIPSSALPPCPDRALRLLASPQGRQAVVLENEPGIQEVLSAAYADLQDVRKCSVSRERFANSSFATLLTSIASTTAVTAASLGVIVGAAWVEWKSPWMGTAVSWGAFLGIHVFLLSQFRRLVARGRSTSLAYGVGRSELSSYRGVAALEVAAGALECSRSISEDVCDIIAHH